VIPDEVEPRRRHERGELLEQLRRFESDVGGAISPRMPEFVAQATVSQSRQALGGDRGTPGVAA
jgi:hypothetical protein